MASRSHLHPKWRGPPTTGGKRFRHWVPCSSTSSPRDLGGDGSGPSAPVVRVVPRHSPAIGLSVRTAEKRPGVVDWGSNVGISGSPTSCLGYSSSLAGDGIPVVPWLRVGGRLDPAGWHRQSEQCRTHHLLRGYVDPESFVVCLPSSAN